jgi:hypothetical protein
MDFRSGSATNVFPVLTPSSSNVQRLTEPEKESFMHPMLLVAIPLGLVILGMILNGIDLGFNQPPSSTEQDPIKKLTAEKESYRKFFDLQRSRSIKRQQRVSQYAWLVMATFVGAFIWLYADTVSKTSLSSQIAGLQTLATEEGKQMVLSVTQSDGVNVKYLIKLPEVDKSQVAAKEVPASEKVSKWEIERLGTALSTGDNPLTLGVALKLSQLAIGPK